MRSGAARVLAAALIALALTACAGRAPTPVGPTWPPVQPPPPIGAGVSPATLPGWEQEDHLSAFHTFADTCPAARDPAYGPACAAARALPTIDAHAARAFLEAWFTVERGQDEGLLTAYFAPEYAARRERTADFDAPVLATPRDLTPGGTYRPRSEIGPSTAQILAWMRAEDLFFLQIQGSGYLTFEDGRQARAAYAADNGRPFTGIARPMAQQGLLPRNGTSGDAIRAWLARHRGPEARAITALNPRYIFFDLQADDGGHPAGAAGVPLPARRAIAVDPTAWKYGDLVWIDADAGNLAGARASYRGLVVALDTGSAIRGPVRADFYMGRGEAAGAEAGAVRHPLRMWRLVPRG